MPLEIRELNIKVQMGGAGGETTSAGPAPAPKSRREVSAEVDEVVSKAVEAMLRIQQDRKER